MTAAARNPADAIRASLAGAAAAARPLRGVLWAALMLLIWAGYPVVTRLSVTQTLSPEDLFALRFGISAGLFLPYLAWRAAELPRDAWLKGVGLASCQGTLAALVITGLACAPASHASALVQGMIPAWLLIAGALAFGGRLHRNGVRGVALIAAGVAIFLAGSEAALDRQVLRGDLMFLAASLLACGYVLQTRRFGLPPAAAAAFVAVYSAAAFLPWYFATAAAPFAQAPRTELLVQALYQGVLVGFISFIALNRAIAALGSTKTVAFMAAVPALTTIVAIPVLGEQPPLADCAALLLITLGVCFTARASQAAASPPRGLLVGPKCEDPQVSIA